MKLKRIATAVAFLLAFSLSASQTLAQSSSVVEAVKKAATPSASQNEEESFSELYEKNKDLQTHLKVEIEELIESLKAEGQIDPMLAKQIELLRSRQITVDEKLAAIKHGAEMLANFKKFSATLSSEVTKGKHKDGSYSYILLDTLNKNEMGQREKMRVTQDASELASDALKTAKNDYERHEAARRKIKEQLGQSQDISLQRELEEQLRIAEVLSENTLQTLELRELEHRCERQSADIAKKRVEVLKKTIQTVQRNVEFTKSDLEDQLIELVRREEDLATALRTAKIELAETERQLVAARKKFAGQSPKRIQLEEIEARKLARQEVQTRVTLLGDRLKRLGARKTAWSQRYELVRGALTEEQKKIWRETGELALVRMERQRRIQVSRLADIQANLTSVASKLEDETAKDPQTNRWLRLQQHYLEQREEVIEQYLASLDTSSHIVHAFLRDFTPKRFTESSWQVFWQTWDTVLSIWGYEITVIDDSAITVGKIVGALILLILGVIASRLVSRWLGNRVFPKMGLTRGMSAALQSIAFYALIFSFALFALRLVHIPLTVFTVLGGALAIGVGFGSQNIVNNFISGLILHIEQPIRVGDAIEIAGLNGIIQRIGARSTVVRRASNVDIIVPNSAFLEQNVVNWTLTNARVRIHVNVGVVYGSNPREVTSLLGHAVEEHARVLSEPPPFVLFKEFGDNALIFEIHYWIRMKSYTDIEIVKSDIRYRIEALLREAGVVIAFPQRDVHLDSTRPLEIRMVSEEDEQAGIVQRHKEENNKRRSSS